MRSHFVNECGPAKALGNTKRNPSVSGGQGKKCNIGKQGTKKSKFLFWGTLGQSNMSRLVSKPTKWHVRPTKTQIRMGTRPVWSESLLSAWRKLGSLATNWAHVAKTVQTGRMPRLIWVLTGRSHFVGFVMRRLIYFSETSYPYFQTVIYISSTVPVPKSFCFQYG